MPRQKDGAERGEREIALGATGKGGEGRGGRLGWQRKRGGATR